MTLPLPLPLVLLTLTLRSCRASDAAAAASAAAAAARCAPAGPGAWGMRMGRQGPRTHSSACLFIVAFTLHKAPPPLFQAKVAPLALWGSSSETHPACACMHRRGNQMYATLCMHRRFRGRHPRRSESTRTE